MHMKRRMITIASLFVLFLLLTGAMTSGLSLSPELFAYHSLFRLESPGVTRLMIIITNIGSAAFIMSVTAFMLAVPRTRRRWGLPLAVTVLASCLLNTTLKVLISRQRPDILWLITEDGYSFPSGHAMNNIAFYTALTLLTLRYVRSRKIRIEAVVCASLMAFGIGLSRIYLGVHYAGDVLAGWALGFCVALTVDTLIHHRRMRFSNQNALFMIEETSHRPILTGNGD